LVSQGKNITSFEDFAQIPDLSAISKYLYPVVDPSSLVQRQSTWWRTTDTAQQGFLGLPYFPYFSNCKDSDSYMSINKVLETDPDCKYHPTAIHPLQ
jgi:hypothetical protein